MAHNIPALEEKLRTLGHSIDRLAAVKHAEQMVPTIRKPGWLTGAEAIFVHAMLDHLQVQVDELARACDSFVTVVKDLGTNRSRNGNAPKVAPGWSADQPPARQAPAGAGALRFMI